MLKASPPSSDLSPLAEAFTILAEIGRKQREAKGETRQSSENWKEQASARSELEPQIENKQTVSM